MLKKMINALKGQSQRSTTKNVTAWLIFGAIILVFVFWGLTPQNNSVGTGGAAAVVNSSVISLAELGEAAENLSRNPFFGRLFEGEAGRKRLHSEALNQLIMGELIAQGAKENGIMVTDAEVRDLIVNEPYFQEDGRFKREKYMAILKAIRKTPAEFEEARRKDEIRMRTLRLFSSALRPTTLEMQKQKELGGLQANVEYVTLGMDTLVAPDSVTAQEVAAFLARPESEKQVTEEFQRRENEFSTPEQASARHILVRAEKGKADAEKVGREKAEDLLKKLQAGADFAALAKAHSDDPGSKAKGGDVGYFSRGRMVPEFEQAAFALKPKEISGVVQSDFGFHIIQLLEIKPAHKATLEEEKSRLARDILARERSQKSVEELKELLAKGDLGAVNQWVQKNKLSWQETGAFGLDAERIPKLGQQDEIAQAAFALSPQQPVYKTLVRQGPTAFVLRYKAVTPIKSKPAEERPEMQQEQWAAERSRQAFQKWLDLRRKNARIEVSAQISQM